MNISLFGSEIYDININNKKVTEPNFVSGNVEEVVDIPTKNDRILDLVLINNPTRINKISTLPPIRLSDHDIVYVEAEA